MPVGPVEHHDGVIIGIQRYRKPIQEQLHRIGVRIGQHQGETPCRRRVFDTTSVPGSTAAKM